jgi:probable HAF family extracellular repeat protein
MMRVLASLFVLWAAPLLGAPIYTVKRIPGVVYDLSENGYVTGRAGNNAFLYKDGVIRDLGFAAEGRNTVGRAVNVHGHVVGGATHVGPRNGLAFVWRNGEFEYLPGFGGFTEALDINDAGWVIGYSEVGAGTFNWHGFLYKDGVMHDLGASVRPDHINNRGQTAYGAINESGSVATYRCCFGTYLQDQAVLIRDGVVTVLNAPGYKSYGWDVNDHDDVVGYYFRDFIDEFPRAFLWRDGTAYDLNNLVVAPDVVLRYPNGINNAGQIIANYHGGAVLLNPVPEPSTVWGVAFGIAILARLRLKR